MRAIAIIGIAVIAGAVAVSVSSKPAKSQSPNEIAQPTPPQEDRELDCRNPQDAAQCRELERGPGIQGLRPPSPTGAYRPPAAQAPAQYGITKPSFNCARAPTIIEQAICSDATLTQWDARMGQLYRQALNIQHNSRILIGDQNRWRALRNNNCSGTNLTETKSCVLEMTKARVGGLAAVVAANGGNPNASPPAGAHIPYPPLSPAMTANPLSQPPAAPDQFKSSPQPQKNSAQTAAPRTSAAELSARQAHQQRIDDARALTAEQWAAPLQLITRIEIGYKCEVIDKLSADVAVMTVGSTMADQQIHNGLVGDTTMVVQQEMAKAIERGRLLFDKNSDQGFCSRFFSSPADRARLRQIVNDLMR